MSVARTQQLEVRVALSPLTTLTRMLIDAFGGIPVSSPSSSSTPGPPAVWGEETHSIPEFMLPAPAGTRTRLREELAQVAATPSSIVRADVYDSDFLSGSPHPPAARQHDPTHPLAERRFYTCGPAGLGRPPS